MSRHAWTSDGFRRAVRFAARGHRDQVRRGSGDPYIVHPILVARTVEAAGFDEAAVIAALLHDLIEDTPITLHEIHGEFGAAVAAIVAGCTEVKHDPNGRPIPWEDRKREHIERLGASARGDAAAVMLADKLDNLRSIRDDLESGRPVWDQFHAGRDRVLWYYAAIIEVCDSGDPRTRPLANDCRRELAGVASLNPKNPDSAAPAS